MTNKPLDVDLSVNFAGVKMRSPVGVAAQAPFSPLSISPVHLTEMLLKHVEAGAGFVHTPYIHCEDQHPKNRLPTGRFMREEVNGFGKLGMFVTAESYRIEMRLQEGLKLVETLKDCLPADVPVIANILGPGADPHGWAEHAAKFEAAGADIIELDVSCPLPANAAGAVESYSSEKIPEHAGVLLGDMAPLTVAVAKASVERCKIPVGVKMSPEVGFPRLIGFVEQLKEVGVSFITSINAPLSVAPPDIYNGGRTLFPGINLNPIAPAIGPWTKYLCYRNIGTISVFVPGMEQAAVGGLVEPANVVEAMMLGAKICEFSSGTLWKGWNLIEASIDFLKKYIHEQGYHSLEDFRGLGTQYIRPVEEVDWGLGKLTATVDPNKCKGCGICANNLCWAMRIEDAKAVVKEKNCSACSLCIAICPNKAVSLTEAKVPREEEEIYAEIMGQ